MGWGCGRFVVENLKHPTEEIVDHAVAAAAALSEHCFHVMSTAWQARVVALWATTARDDVNPAARRGFALALGRLHPRVLAPSLDVALEGLIPAATVIDDNPESRDAEARRNAVRGVTSLALAVGAAGGKETVGVEDSAEAAGGLRAGQARAVVEALLRAMGDYCVDNRGDVGSWVREAAMYGAVEVCAMLGAEGDAGPLTPQLVSGVVGALLQNACEKMDRVRAAASVALAALLRARVPHIPERTLLESVMLEDDALGGVAIDWASPAVAFPRLVRLLDEVTRPMTRKRFLHHSDRAQTHSS